MVLFRLWRRLDSIRGLFLNEESYRRFQCKDKNVIVYARVASLLSHVACGALSQIKVK